MRYVTDLPGIHVQIDVSAKLVWGDRYPLFAVERAKPMMGEFPTATLDVLPNIGLFSHGEALAAVAESRLPTLLG
jgi:hypothetical protein